MALLERDTFKDYRAGWLEALGDIARHRIVIAGSCSAPWFVFVNHCWLSKFVLIHECL
jgi:hypothetical protein